MKYKACCALIILCFVTLLGGCATTIDSGPSGLPYSCRAICESHGYQATATTDFAYNNAVCYCASDSDEIFTFVM